MRVVALNIQHGGGRRTNAIADAILSTGPDVVVLSEFHTSSVGFGLLARLAEAGLGEHVHGEQGSRAYPNTVAVVSRLPLASPHLPLANPENRQRVLEVDVDGFTLGAVYFPLGKTKVTFWRDDFLPYAATRIERRCLLVGDWNSGSPHLDEVGATLDGAKEFAMMAHAGWIDAWRSLHPADREYTWYTTIGNGFRIDHAFVSPSLASRLLSSTYRHETRTRGVTDHSMLVVDLSG